MQLTMQTKTQINFKFSSLKCLYLASNSKNIKLHEIPFKAINRQKLSGWLLALQLSSVLLQQIGIFKAKFGAEASELIGRLRVFGALISGGRLWEA
jgi:hypothetical protein